MPRIITKKCFNDLIFTLIFLCTSHRTIASRPEKFKAMHPDSRTTSVTSTAHLSRSKGDSGWPTLYLLELRYFIAPLRGDFKHRLAGIEIPLINREANSGVLEIDMACSRQLSKVIRYPRYYKGKEVLSFTTSQKQYQRVNLNRHH